MKILVTGANGMLGTDLVPILKRDGHEVVATDIEEMDITIPDKIKEVVSAERPDIIINCAAYTQVDKAEEEPDKAFLVNGLGVQNLALACKKLDIDLCHISTDYVFDGKKNGPYAPDDMPHPINTYGKSKLAGERYIREAGNKFYIIRTSWLYGKYGRNFVYTVLDLAKEKKELKVVDDQIGSPTWTITLSQVLVKLIQTQKYGIYHATNETAGGISWYEFAKEIMRSSGLKTEVTPVKTAKSPRLAKRPKNSVLDLTAIKLVLHEDILSWKKSLEKFLSEL